MKKQVNFRLNTELHDGLKKLAKKRYMNTTQMVEQLIVEELARNAIKIVTDEIAHSACDIEEFENA